MLEYSYTIYFYPFGHPYSVAASRSTATPTAHATGRTVLYLHALRHYCESECSLFLCSKESAQEYHIEPSHSPE